MARLNRFSSFLDRFDEQMAVNGERVKSELNEWIDQRVVLVQAEVRKMKTRFCGIRSDIGQLDGNLKGLEDDPQVETVSFEFIEHQASQLGDDENRNQLTTSSGRKRKSTNQIGDKPKKVRSGGTDGSKRYTCKFPGCGKSFLVDFSLAEHERIHQNIKPFSCTWPDCRYMAVRKAHIVLHIRTKHFKLPVLQKEQIRLNIVDNRNPEDYVLVDNQLFERRLE